MIGAFSLSIPISRREAINKLSFKKSFYSFRKAWIQKRETGAHQSGRIKGIMAESVKHRLCRIFGQKPEAQRAIGLHTPVRCIYSSAVLEQ